MNGRGSRLGGWQTRGLLAEVTPATAAALLDTGTERIFGGDHVLLREEELSTHVILLIEGCVKVTATTVQGGVALLAIRVGGELVGELAGLDGRPRSATVTTAGRVRARILSQSVFQSFLRQYPDAALAVSRSVGEKLRWATKRRVDFSGFEVRIRLARVLIELAASYGEDTDEGLEIGIPLTQPELAALVGAAEPTVHRALAELRRRGVVKTGYGRIKIRERSALRTMAEDEDP